MNTYISYSILVGFPYAIIAVIKNPWDLKYQFQTIKSKILSKNQL